MSRFFELSGVSYTYPAAEDDALFHVDLTVETGTVTAVLGPNGAGKSTLLDLLLGWRRPETGSLLLKGKPLHQYGKRERSRLISLVPQNEPIQFSFTLLDYVLFGRAPYLPQLGSPDQNDIDIALRALDLVGLDISPYRSVTSLSGGQGQLLMLARSIAQEPEMIILDEPTSSLDPGNTAVVHSIIESLEQAGHTILFTTHDPNFAAESADSIAMLKHGRMLAHLPTDEALTREHISELYDTPIEVIRHGGRPLVFRR